MQKKLDNNELGIISVMNDLETELLNLYVENL